MIQLGRDAYVAPGETADTVVAVGGNVRVAGTVRNAVVAIGGDVRVEPGATVGGGVTSDDVVLVTVGGQVVSRPGAAVTGRTLNVTGRWIEDLFDDGLSFGTNGWFDGGAMIGGWLTFTLFFMMVALLATLILPRQVSMVRDQVSREFWPSLGWGALTALVLIPLASVLLLVTVVGILALVPGLLIALPLVLFFGFVGVSTLVGGQLVAALGGRRDNLVLAGIVGVAILGLLNLVPVAGAIVLAVAWMVGLGATVLVVRNARRQRSAAQAGPAAPSTPQAPAAPPATAAPGAGAFSV